MCVYVFFSQITKNKYRRRRQRAIAVTLDRLKCYWKRAKSLDENYKDLGQSAIGHSCRGMCKSMSLNERHQVSTMDELIKGQMQVDDEVIEQDKQLMASCGQASLAKACTESHRKSQLYHFESDHTSQLDFLPPLRFLDTHEIIARLWSDEESLMKRTLNCLKSKLSEECYEPFLKMYQSTSVDKNPNESLQIIRNKLAQAAQMLAALQHIPTRQYLAAAADILWLYSNTQRFFTCRQQHLSRGGHYLIVEVEGNVSVNQFEHFQEFIWMALAGWAHHYNE
ncbi:hypothetical protein RFI_27835, partial [Reticulomyxa filosa]